MKKFLLLLVCLILIQFNAFSQKLYMKTSFGASMAAVPQQYNTSESHYFSDGSYERTDYEMEKGSYGAGLRGVLGLGTMVTDNVGLELNVFYLMGYPQQSYFNMYVDEHTDKSTTSSSGKMLAFAPSLLVTSKGRLINPYAKAGLVISKPKIIQETTRIFADDQVYTNVFEVNGKTALGFQGGIGANYKISERLSLFSEVSFVMLSFTPVKGKTTSYLVNGEDHLGSLSESQKGTEFVTSISSNEIGDASKPRQSFNNPLPFNHVGIQIGIQFAIFE